MEKLNLKNRLTQEYRVIDDEMKVTKVTVVKSEVNISIYYLVAILLFCFITVTVDRSYHLKLNDEEITRLTNENDSLSRVVNEMQYQENIENLHYLAGRYLSNPTHIIPTQDSVYSLLLECKAWYPDLILAQFVLESGSGTSNVAKCANNLFGIKRVSRNKETTQLGDSFCGYGIYKNWQLSVIDRVMLDYRHFDSKPSKDSYEKMLSQRYSEDEAYLDKLHTIIKQF